VTVSDTNPSFSFELGCEHPRVDRVTLMLVVPSFVSPCTGADGACFGQHYDVVTRYHVPYAVDQTTVLGFGTYYLRAGWTNHEPSQTAQDVSIRNLMDRLSPCYVDDSPACNLDPPLASDPPRYLIRSYRDMDTFFLYDQALAAIAFVGADDGNPGNGDDAEDPAGVHLVSDCEVEIPIAIVVAPAQRVRRIPPSVGSWRNGL
jgi:hypothetical protein